jgi:hypothetical protein
VSIDDFANFFRAQSYSAFVAECKTKDDGNYSVEISFCSHRISVEQTYAGGELRKSTCVVDPDA